MRKIRSSNIQNRKGAEQQQEQKEKTPILKGENEITSIKDYTPDSYTDGWKYIYGVDTTNQTINTSDLYIRKTNEGSSVEMETNYDDSFNLSSSNIKFHPCFGIKKTNIIVTTNYYYPYIGDKVFVLISRILNYIRTQWNEETYEQKITLLKDDFEPIIKLINNMTTTNINIDSITNFYDINKAIVKPVYKDYVKRISVVELFNLYRTVRDNTMNTYCYKFLDNTREYPFERNGVDLEIVSEYTDNEGVFLSYYVPGTNQEPYQIWNCNEYKELPAEFTDKDKTIEFTENDVTKEYYKVIMVRKIENENITWYPMLYLDWGEYDVDEIIKFDPKSIEPTDITPLTYYYYIKKIWEHIYWVCTWAENNYNDRVIGFKNNQNYKFVDFIGDYKNQFPSCEIYRYYALCKYISEYVITVYNFLDKHIEKIKTFYKRMENEDNTDFVQRITCNFINQNNNDNETYMYDQEKFEGWNQYLDEMGYFQDGIFTYVPPTDSNYIGDQWLEYIYEYHNSPGPIKPDAEPFVEYSEDIRDYFKGMKWIYSKTSDPANLIMSFDQNPEIVVNAGEGQYTEYEIKDN